MSGRKTSVYLSEARAAALDADPRTLPEVIDAGLACTGHPVAEPVTPAPERSAGLLLTLAAQGDVELVPPPEHPEPEPDLGHRTVNLGTGHRALPQRDGPLVMGIDLLRADADGRRGLE